MRSAWRIVRAERVDTAFTGEGSRLYGGRWNSRATPVVYGTEHESLAALEILVHTIPLSPTERYLSFRVDCDNKLTEYFPIKNQPPLWKAKPPTTGSIRVGRDWVLTGRSALLALP